MSSSSSAARRRAYRSRRSASSEDIETIDLPTMNSSAVAQENAQADESPLVDIIQRRRRKDWAKVVAPMDGDQKKKTKESISKRLSKILSKLPSPTRALLNFIERRNGYTIRSYFEFIIWLFYLNIFAFILTFTCIIMPTYIYSNSMNFSSYAMDQYHHRYNRTSDVCSLTDPQCQALEIPLTDQGNISDSTCLDDPYTASSCCSLYADAFFVNSSSRSENEWTRFVIDLFDGTGYLTITRLFIGYYQNLTTSNGENSYFQTYNMSLAVFLVNFVCFLLTGIIIVRKYGNGMKRSYVQNESFKNDLFQYIFARWDYRLHHSHVARRHEQRFKTEIKNILFELNDKVNFKFDRAKEKIIFQFQRILLWIGTLIMFAGAIAALFFTNQYTFQQRAKKELNSGVSSASRFEDLVVEYLPSVVISAINLFSQIIFDYMRNFQLYTRTTALRHYLIRVIIMRLLLLFTFFFIIILQITCNSNQCGRQSELIDCAGIQGQATFIHCWETLIGQAIYRLVLTDTAVMLLVHIIVDPLRSMFICCCGPRAKVDDVSGTAEPPAAACFLCQRLEFEVGDYVLDLTYTQTLCWHGLLFCPFLPLIAAAKNIVIFLVKFLSLVTLRRRSGLELSPARAHYVFTTVLLFSFVWALLPIAFLTTSLRPSRGCGPFRLYSHEPDFFIYYSIRNLVLQIPNQIVVDIITKLSSAVIIIPLVLCLILLSCILTIRRNSYRGASVELYKLLYTSKKTHQLAVQKTSIVSSIM